MCNHSPPPLRLSLFIHRFLASITAFYNPLFNTSVVYPVLNNILRLVFSPTLTSSSIRPTSLTCSSNNASWNPSSKYCMPVLSPPSLWKTQPSNSLSYSNKTSIHLPTHIRISIPESVTSAHGITYNLSPFYPLNRPFKVTTECNCYLINLVSSQNSALLSKRWGKIFSPK